MNEKTNWSWQFSQFQQQIGEWFEYETSRLRMDVPGLSPEFAFPNWVRDLFNLLSWSLLGLLVAWIGWRLWQEFSPYWYSWLNQTGNPINSRSKENQSEVSVSKLWKRSQEFYHQGNYREGCRCLYFAMLQKLHEKQVLPHKKSRTDGEYLRLLQLSISPMQPYETLITTHEQLCFDDGEVSSDNYQQCQQAYREIENAE
jgi:Domain of unknown function (DUF4129)